MDALAQVRCGILVLTSAAERALRVGVDLGGMMGGVLLYVLWMAARIKR